MFDIIDVRKSIIEQTAANCINKKKPVREGKVPDFKKAPTDPKNMKALLEDDKADKAKADKKKADDKAKAEADKKKAEDKKAADKKKACAKEGKVPDPKLAPTDDKYKQSLLEDDKKKKPAPKPEDKEPDPKADSPEDADEPIEIDEPAEDEAPIEEPAPEEEEVIEDNKKYLGQKDDTFYYLFIENGQYKVVDAEEHEIIPAETMTEENTVVDFLIRVFQELELPTVSMDIIEEFIIPELVKQEEEEKGFNEPEEEEEDGVEPIAPSAPKDAPPMPAPKKPIGGKSPVGKGI